MRGSRPGERRGGRLEEVTRLLLERGEQGGIQAIPPTLQQSLTARLDRLGPARDLAQVGSVIGRDFSYALLRAVAGMEDAQLQAALEQLAEADVLLVQGMSPDAEYRFKEFHWFHVFWSHWFQNWFHFFGLDIGSHLWIRSDANGCAKACNLRDGGRVAAEPLARLPGFWASAVNGALLVLQRASARVRP
jgi:hypothetical protein